VATDYEHYFDDPVTVLIGNQIKIYRSPNVNGLQPDDSAFVYHATVDIDPDQLETTYTDPSGSSEFWYKLTYSNSTTTAETSLADSGSARGGGVGQYVSIEDIRNEAGFKNNHNISDTLIDQKRQVAQAEVNAAASSRYAVPFASPVNPIIANITLMIAVKYLLLSQYGAFDSMTGAKEKIEMAENQLARITEGSLVLVAADGSSLALPSSGSTSTGGTSDLGMSGFPNAQTASLKHDELGAGDFMFKRSMIDGYGEREY
jgi:hypothetical protein